jgi:hypothetical protein
MKNPKITRKKCKQRYLRKPKGSLGKECESIA